MAAIFLEGYRGSRGPRPIFTAQAWNPLIDGIPPAFPILSGRAPRETGREIRQAPCQRHRTFEGCGRAVRALPGRRASPHVDSGLSVAGELCRRARSHHANERRQWFTALL